MFWEGQKQEAQVGHYGSNPKIMEMWATVVIWEVKRSNQILDLF